MLLITGGNGFLGKHICKRLSRNHIAPKSIRINLLEKQNTIKYVGVVKPKKILHLAAKCGGIGYNLNNPAPLIHDNIQMALNVFEAARLSGVREVITIGSTCQYPLNASSPFNVDNMWDGYPEPSNGAYGIAKRAISAIGDAYMRQYGINHKHLILANLYGPGDKSDHVIPDLLRKFKNDDRIEVWGDGSSVREFLYVGDAADIIISCMDKPFIGPANIGSGKTVSIKELVELMKTVTKSKKEIVYNPIKPNGQGARLLQNDYSGKTALIDGLRKTWSAIDK